VDLERKGSLSASLISSAAKIKSQNLLFIYPNEFMKLSKYYIIPVVLDKLKQA
jgi:hypothetical protein